MTFSLYDATIPSYLQMLTTVGHLLDKAEADCRARGVAEASLLGARLADDMLPFAYQVKSTAVHSLGAIEGVRVGTFSPDRSEPPADIAGLRAQVEVARTAIAALDRAEVDSFIGRDMAFVVGDVMRMDFAADQFLLSFAQPSFYFHVTTAYAILRANGIKIGKRDYLGPVRVRA